MLRESNCKEDSRDVKTARKLSRRKKETENSAPMSLVMIEGDEVRNKMSPMGNTSVRTRIRTGGRLS